MSKKEQIYHITVLGNEKKSRLSMQFNSIQSNRPISLKKYIPQYDDCYKISLEVKKKLFTFGIYDSDVIMTNSNGYVLVYSVDSRESFIDICNLADKLKGGSFPVPLVIVGYRGRLYKRCVTYQEGKDMANKLGICFFEACSKNNKNIKNILNCLVDQIC